ncbi:MAG: 50S ribosomal protein L25 [Deltaproteobacteria bacterium]|nr:50S ribosomal protein L25 [Deltaproteobacteria bacterium]
MEVGKLTVEVRNSVGHKGASRQLRTQGKVPGVCYGASVDGKIAPLPIIIDVKALKGALDPVRKQNTVISLTITNDGKTQSLHALVKEYQLHPLRREITHVDLLAIDPNKEVLADVPLEFVGKPKGAIEGGQIRIVLRKLEVRAKPSDIPVKLTIDVSPLEIGDVIHVHAIALPEGVTTATLRDLAVVTCAAPEEDKVATTADGTAPAEGAAAAPAAAVAPAAGGKAAAPAAGKAAPAAKAPAKK